MKKVLLPFLLIAFGLASCQKLNQKPDNLTSSVRDNSAKSMMGTLGINPANPSNPDDSIGFYHNQLVDFYFQKGYSLSTSKDSIMSWNNQFVSQNLHLNNFETLEQNDTFQQLLNNSYNTFTVDTLINHTNMDYAAGFISHQAHTDMLQFISMVSSIDTDSVLTTSTIQYVINQIDSMETNVIASGMSTNDKNYILSQTSVCRYSLAYWYNVSNSSQSNFSLFSANNNGGYHLTAHDLSMIAFADTRGAQMAYETGAVGWAVLVSGGNVLAGLAVAAASAAIFSASAYYAIVHH